MIPTSLGDYQDLGKYYILRMIHLFHVIVFMKERRNKLCLASRFDTEGHYTELVCLLILVSLKQNDFQKSTVCH